MQYHKNHKMEVFSVLRMNGGIGDLSYAQNSILQHKAIILTMPIVEEAITTLYSNLKPACREILKIADLGCSSGPNTLLTISQLIKTVDKIRKKMRFKRLQEIQIYLNDLPGNDFNLLFRSLKKFQEQLRNEVGSDFGSCFFNGVPGSFYHRLFPTNTLHFVHSSYSLMWLSQVPDGIEENKAHICLSRTSPKSVVQAYFEQFQKDFLAFLKCRSVELITGGYMVLTIFGRKSVDPRCLIWELLGHTLQDMVSEGLIKVETLNSFNVPLYTPSPEELRSIIENEGSFAIDRLETSSVSWNFNDNRNSFISNGTHKDDDGYDLARCMRSVAEPIILDHFGHEIIEKVFYKYREKISNYMAKHTAEFINVTVSLRKRKREHWCITDTVKLIIGLKHRA